MLTSPKGMYWLTYMAFFMRNHAFLPPPPPKPTFSFKQTHYILNAIHLVMVCGGVLISSIVHTFKTLMARVMEDKIVDIIEKTFR